MHCLTQLCLDDDMYKTIISRDHLKQRFNYIFCNERARGPLYPNMHLLGSRKNHMQLLGCTILYKDM